MSLGGFWLQFPGLRMCFAFWMGPISGPERGIRNLFPLFSLEQPDWYAASSPAVPYSSWEGLGAALLLSVCAWPSQVLKNKSCTYMQAQCHGCHSAGLQWTSGSQMNNFVLNNSSRQPEEPSQLTGSFTAFRGERSTGSTWNIRRGKRIENSRGSLTFASSPTWTGSGMLSPNKGTCFFSSSLPLSLSIQLFTCIPTGMKREEGYCLAVINFGMHRCSDIENWDQFLSSEWEIIAAQLNL